MNRSAKATIALLLLCIAGLIFMIFYLKHENRNRWHDVRTNCQYGIITSHTINSYMDMLIATKSDTSALFLYHQYEFVRNDQFRWNNSQLFNLAYVVSESEDNHDSLLMVYRAYSNASIEIMTFLAMHKDATELHKGDVDELIALMQQLALATARFENFEFDE